MSMCSTNDETHSVILGQHAGEAGQLLIHVVHSGLKRCSSGHRSSRGRAACGVVALVEVVQMSPAGQRDG
jgi:hypothetical protein